jgi:Domain of unknown function (DUF4292)
MGGCSVTRNIEKGALENSNKVLSLSIAESVKFQNLTDTSFFIQKAEIEVINQDGKEKFISTIKYEKPDKYLISIKSRTGIEGARIFISKDSILINDRINKKIYFANSFYLKRKYGLPLSCFPLIFGDIVLEKNCDTGQIRCSEDKMNIDCLVNGLRLRYDIDCKKRKVILVNQMDNFVQDGIKIRYESFFKLGNMFFPGIVELEDTQYNTTIKIKFSKIEFPWNGNVKFVPGKGYELIELV